MAALLLLPFLSSTLGCEYVAHSNTIGPKSEQTKKDEFACSSAAACIPEASAACTKTARCFSFGYNAKWQTARAQLYTTHWNASYEDSDWTLYACAGDAPPAPHPPPNSKTLLFRFLLPTRTSTVLIRTSNFENLLRTYVLSTVLMPAI